uniref:Uncharacterized protein n=1 Tax=Rhizophora mucronata TaxID=61149 RepID=A0A2P2R4H4_RHIMU
MSYASCSNRKIKMPPLHCYATQQNR